MYLQGLFDNPVMITGINFDLWKSIVRKKFHTFEYNQIPSGRLPVVRRKMLKSEIAEKSQSKRLRESKIESERQRKRELQPSAPS